MGAIGVGDPRRFGGIDLIKAFCLNVEEMVTIRCRCQTRDSASKKVNPS